MELEDDGRRGVGSTVTVGESDTAPNATPQVLQKRLLSGFSREQAGHRAMGYAVYRSRHDLDRPSSGQVPNRSSDASLVSFVNCSTTCQASISLMNPAIGNAIVSVI